MPFVLCRCKAIYVLELRVSNTPCRIIGLGQLCYRMYTSIYIEWYSTYQDTERANDGDEGGERWRARNILTNSPALMN